MRSTGGPLDRAMTKIRDRFPDRPALVKTPGMFGSAHDGERATAALQLERIRAKVGASWSQLIVQVILPA